ncbi:MAG: 2OG-Fe(II) oxygenase [Breznakibacter sp.]
MKQIFDPMMDNLDANGFAVVDGFIDTQSVNQLLHNASVALQQGGFRDAGIGRQTDHHTNKSIRSDQVMWMTQQTILNWCPQLSSHLNALVDYLNQTCYAGINHSEFHMAHYGPGAFYKRHVDQFRKNGDRRFTVIVYLNLNWQPLDGGQLMVYPPDGPHEVVPKAGRLVFFESGVLEHEVMLSKNSRWSFTGWLKNVRIPQMPCSTNY